MRLDKFLVLRFDFSRQKASELIKNGCVLVDNRPIFKPSFETDSTFNIEIKKDMFIDSKIYCSRAAFKLSKFLQNNELNGQIFLDSKANFIESKLSESIIKYIKNSIINNIKNNIVIDVGASSGGFTQVLLSKGANLVIAQDVGDNQLDSTLRENHKVISVENMDIRDFVATFLKGKMTDVTFVTSLQKCLNYELSGDIKKILESKKEFAFLSCDISFISLRKVIDSLTFLSKNLLLLFKPQFEVGIEAKRNKKGVLKDSKIIKESLNSFLDLLKQKGANSLFIEESLLKGKEGNKEFFIYARF
ncbi:hemolysin [Helicobacter saguini]|uniref:Hemolysin n=1 Tax=Helicobacter saguini TaxID=1548018 RepID=A0A347VPE0_9HELI|nr:SAM-dependent methyltransferase [Helicobacter saguini]MWV61403.1 hemolysin [Helicobacter saguini]MWV67929.1 hemolysin [Helicobacter saguini]MWV70604.1 hemolysin [Helicobacter saguini]MWV72508.1 hemolysin [Helicobacter saguini]TLD94748.1 hemolysin [Helicobacter saguini]